MLDHFEALDTPAGTRYRAKRMIARQQRYIPIGNLCVVGVAANPPAKS